MIRPAPSRPALQRLLVAALLLLGVFVAGPGHQLLHLGHGSHGADASSGCSDHACQATSDADEAVALADGTVERGDLHDHGTHRGCALCSLSLDAPGCGVLDGGVRCVAGPVPVRPAEHQRTVEPDRSISERGPPHRA